jgi:hypothetical protein
VGTPPSEVLTPMLDVIRNDRRVLKIAEKGRSRGGLVVI